MTEKEKVFKAGATVLIEGEETKLVRPMPAVPGGWVVSPAVQGFKAWNESLEKAQDSGVADVRRLPPLLPRGPDS